MAGMAAGSTRGPFGLIVALGAGIPLPLEGPAMDKLKMIQQIAALGRELAALQAEREQALGLSDLEAANRLGRQIADRLQRKDALSRQL